MCSARLRASCNGDYALGGGRHRAIGVYEPIAWSFLGENGCRQLNASLSSVTYEVLDLGERKKLFRAARAARVRVTTR